MGARLVRDHTGAVERGGCPLEMKHRRRAEIDQIQALGGMRDLEDVASTIAANDLEILIALACKGYGRGALGEMIEDDPFGAFDRHARPARVHRRKEIIDRP